MLSQPSTSGCRFLKQASTGQHSFHFPTLYTSCHNSLHIYQKRDFGSVTSARRNDLNSGVFCKCLLINPLIYQHPCDISLSDWTDLKWNPGPATSAATNIADLYRARFASTDSQPLRAWEIVPYRWQTHKIKGLLPLLTLPHSLGRINIRNFILTYTCGSENKQLQAKAAERLRQVTLSSARCEQARDASSPSPQGGLCNCFLTLVALISI